MVPRVHFLSDLYGHSQDDPNATILRDASSGKEFSREKLLLDTFAFRDRLLSQLDARTHTSLHSHDEEVYIAVLLPLSYEFVVAFLAVLSIGAIATPLGEYRDFTFPRLIQRKQIADGKTDFSYCNLTHRSRLFLETFQC